MRCLRCAPVRPDELEHDEWIVLHEVRLRGVHDPGPGAIVAALVETGLVVTAPRGLRLTPVGRDAHTAWARVEPGSEAEAAVERAYQRFMTLNTELLRLCHDWQVRPGGLANDHRDAAYDWAIVDRLVEIDDRTAPIVRRVAEVVPRFGGYRASLRAAREHVHEGRHEWFTSPRIDSYHTVWMHLHEDLLLALGRDRASEP
jgi:hypothetical protein